jgi:hypothetical protein
MACFLTRPERKEGCVQVYTYSCTIYCETNEAYTELYLLPNASIVTIHLIVITIPKECSALHSVQSAGVVC